MRLTRFLLLPSLATASLVIVREPDAAPDPKPEAGSRVTGTVLFIKNGKQVAQTDESFVYLKPVRRTGVVKLKPVTVAMHQRDQKFIPRRLVIPLGSTVAFPNDDKNEPHNVFSPTVPFNLLKYSYPESKSRTFDAVGVFDIYCDIHFDMNAKINVIDSDQIARVVDGKFTLVDVPPGSYKLTAWEPNSKPVTEPTILEVEAGKQLVVPFEPHLQVGDPDTNHKRANGSPYTGYKKGV